MTRITLATCLCALVLGAGMAASAAAAGPTATAARTCDLSLKQQRNAGATYLVQLTVSRLSCRKGLRIEKAYQRCRRDTRGQTTCKRRVRRFRCAQRILASSRTQYDAKVSCKRGRRKVGFIYTQNK